MKHLIFILLTCTLSTAAVTVTGVAHLCVGSGTTCNENSAFTAIAGDDMVVECGTDTSATHIAPTDSGSNSYTQVGATTTIGAGKVSFWYSTNVIGFTSGHVACNTSATTSAILMAYSRINGLELKSLDATSTIQTYASTASPWASSNLTTINPNDIIVVFFEADVGMHTMTAPSGFTLSATNGGLDPAIATELVSTKQNTTYAWTGTGAADNVAVLVMAFKNTATLTPISPFVIGP